MCATLRQIKTDKTLHALSMSDVAICTYLKELFFDGCTSFKPSVDPENDSIQSHNNRRLELQSLCPDLSVGEQRAQPVGRVRTSTAVNQRLAGRLARPERQVHAGTS